MTENLICDWSRLGISSIPPTKLPENFIQILVGENPILQLGTFDLPLNFSICLTRDIGKPKNTPIVIILVYLSKGGGSLSAVPDSEGPREP